MSVTLRLYDGAGAFKTMLPLSGDVSIMDVFNEEGSGTLNYFAEGVGANDLRGINDGSIGVHLDGLEVFRFLVEDDEDDEASDAGGARTIRIGGQGMLGLLARGIVLPEDGIGAIPAIHPFKDATPGAIMGRLLTKMTERGYLTNVTTSFTATHDSAGVPWDVFVTIEYDAGKDLLTVVKDLAAQGGCDVRMVGHRLDLFRPNTALAVDKPNIYLRRAHAEQALRRRSKRDLRTDYLVVGDEGINMLKFDQAARDVYGRRIGFVGQGNTVSSSTLDRIAAESLKQNARPSRGYTISLRPDHPSCPKPYVDFTLGDSIRSDFIYSEKADVPGGGYEPLRVRSITTTFGADGATKVSLELNDRFLEAILDLARRVEGIRHGSVAASSAPPSMGPVIDKTFPAAPSGITIRPKTSLSAEGVKVGTLFVEWPAVTTNNDGTAATDIDAYEVRYRLTPLEVPGADGQPTAEEPQYVLAGSTETTGMLLTNLPIRTPILIEIRTVDKTGNASDWFVAGNLMTPMGDESPPDPSAPVLSSRLGGVHVQWDRRDATGGAAAADLAEVEVHAGPTADFIVTAATQVGAMIGTSAFITGLPAGTPVWIRLRMRDYTGNYSDPSVAAQITPETQTYTLDPNLKINGAQLTPGTVGTEQLVVGVLSDGMILNGGFEEVTDSGQPVGWTWNGAAGTSMSLTTDLPKQGSRALQLTATANVAAEAECTPFYPMQEFGQFYLAGHFKGPADRTGEVGINWYGPSKVYLNVYTPIAPVPMTGAWKLGEQVVKAPAGAAYGKVVVKINAGPTAATAWVDGVDLRLATGKAQILNASISSAAIEEAAIKRVHIGQAEVGDANIQSLAVGKLVAGELSATYVTVTGRLTSRSGGLRDGQRWELDNAGFRAYNSAGAQTVNLASDGSAYFAGTIGSGATITGANVTGGSVVGALVSTASSGPRVEVRALGTYSNSLVFYGDYEATPVYFNVRTRNAMTLRIPDPLSSNYSTLFMDPDRIKLDVSSGLGYNSFEVYGNRLQANQVNCSSLYSSGGVFDRGNLVYSPINPGPYTRNLGGNTGQQNVRASFAAGTGAIITGTLFWPATFPTLPTAVVQAAVSNDVATHAVSVSTTSLAWRLFQPGGSGINAGNMHAIGFG